MREQGARTRSERHRPHRERGRVLRSVQEPAHRHGRSLAARKRGREGSSRAPQGAPGHTTERARFDVGQTGISRRNRRRDWVVRMLRGSPRISTRHLPFGAVTREPDASEPGRRLRPPSTNARTRRAQAKWPYVVAVAEVVRRRRVPNTLAQRPPKRGTARVNEDLARGRAPAVSTARCALSEVDPERKDEREPDRAVEPGRGIGEVPG